MHTSVVMLRPGNIVEIAKGVLRPSGWNCEWNISSQQPCKIMLSSWDGYMKVGISVFTCFSVPVAYLHFITWGIQLCNVAISCHNFSTYFQGFSSTISYSIFLSTLDNKARYGLFLPHALTMFFIDMMYQRNTFICCLPRCNIPAGLTINSYNDLVVHIQQSHLNRVHLYCPVKGMPNLIYSRSN